MAPWELRLKRVQAMIDAMDLKTGDVITFTKSIQQRLGNSTSRTYFMTIEGNTSPEGATGSQQNGGGVYARKRYFGKTVHAIARPAYQTIPVTK